MFVPQWRQKRDRLTTGILPPENVIPKCLFYVFLHKLNSESSQSKTFQHDVHCMLYIKFMILSKMSEYVLE